MADRPALVLIDGSALAYRSFFAFIRNPLINSRGENTSAVFGFASTMLRILEKDPPDYLVVCFDTSAPTFRHERYPEYKSTRARMPDELAESLPRIDELVDALGVILIKQDGIEADDIIGTLATRGEAEGMDVIIHSGDKDFCQLVSDRVKLLRPKSGESDELLDAGGVKERMGVAPAQIVDLLALMGDSSDNVPGVPGVGAKTAVKLLDEHGSLDGILENAGTIKGKLGERISEHRGLAELSRELVIIRTDEPLGVEFEGMRPGVPDRARLAAFFKEMEFQRFTNQFTDAQEGPETDYRTVRSLDELREMTDRLLQADAVAFDTETTSINPMEARLVGLSFACREGEAWYVPVGHVTPAPAQGSLLGDVADAGDASDAPANLPLEKTLEILRTVLENPDVPKIAQHAKYDASVLLNHGVKVRGVDFDTMLAAYLLDPARGRFGMDVLALEELNHRTISYSELTGKGKKQISIAEVELEKVGIYACEDADITLRLRNRFAPRLEEFGLRDLFDEVEMPLSEVLMSMERHGVRLDMEVFGGLARELGEEIVRLEREIHDLAGHPFNIKSPIQLRAVLFDELGLPPGRRTKSGPSTDSDVLDKLSSQHALPAKILEHRQYAKLLSTYVETLPRLVRADTGRLHTSYHRTVAATGRLSSSDPNLQNIPIRTEMGRRIRAGFIPPKGWSMLSADYSQVELRVLASICGDPGLTEAFRTGVDVHQHTAAAVFDLDPDKVSGEQRARAKAVNFGVIYGQGARGLGDQLKISQAEAQAFIDAYFERYSSVDVFRLETLDRARRDGYVTTLLGRRRYLPDIHDSNHQRRAYAERTAVNTVIQGTAADLIKVAMVRIARRMHTAKMDSAMLLQVHDELIFEAPEAEREPLEALVREEMQSALELNVPLVVDAGWGANWLEAH